MFENKNRVEVIGFKRTRKDRTDVKQLFVTTVCEGTTQTILSYFSYRTYGFKSKNNAGFNLST